MATYYVSPAGSDSNNGLGPDPAHATNKPFLTPSKVLTGVVTSGDVVWFAPGIYYTNGAVTLAAATAGVTYRGDPRNTQGFKSGGVLIPPGIAQISWRASASILDALPSTLSIALFAGKTNKPDNLTWQDLWLEGGLCVFNLDAGDSTGWTIQDCALFAHSKGCIFWDDASGTPTTLNMTVQRCLLFAGSNTNGGAIVFDSGTAVAASSADVDVNVQVKSCLIFGRAFNGKTLGTSAGNKAGGVDFVDCTVVYPHFRDAAFATTASQHSVNTPSTITGCLVIGPNSMVSAGDSGAITSGGFNRTMLSFAADTNYTPAASDVRCVMPNLFWPGLMQKWGFLPVREAFGWIPGIAHANQIDNTSYSDTALDFFGGVARPHGAGVSIGAMELPSIAKDTGSAITGGGANSLKIDGSGEVVFFCPVDANTTAIRVTTKSTSYGGTTWPSLVVKANADAGIFADVTASASSATEQQISASITPSGAAVVEVLLRSQSTTPGSATFFDLLEAVG